MSKKEYKEKMKEEFIRVDIYREIALNMLDLCSEALDDKKLTLQQAIDISNAFANYSRALNDLTSVEEKIVRH